MKFNYYLGLGSNIDPKFEYLQKSIIELNKIGKVIKKSGIYETIPWGGVKQNNFLNAVVRFCTDLNPFHLLLLIKDIEEKIGRKRDEVIWGPREIDIDILFVDNICIDKKYLTVPHKYFKQRNFILKPMAELDSDYKPENNEQSIKYYLDNSTDQNYVNKSIENW
jgi:2-amino-4-hydroxy-6-hydroxymethyldihydropteridine diphosphokinase